MNPRRRGCMHDQPCREGNGRSGGGDMNNHRAMGSRGAATLAVLAIVLSACSGGATTAPSVAAPPSYATGGASAPASQVAAASLASCGAVNIAVNPWVGYEADAAVVSYLLTNKLGCTVVKKNIDEQTSWQGFPTGEVDAIL